MEHYDHLIFQLMINIDQTDACIYLDIVTNRPVHPSGWETKDNDFREKAISKFFSRLIKKPYNFQK